jgi:hypothetical protein
MIYLDMSIPELEDYRKWREALKAPPEEVEQPNEEVLAYLVVEEGKLALKRPLVRQPQPKHFADEHYG